DRPGIYNLYNDNKILAHWAVNYNPEESDDATFAPEDLIERVKAEQVSIIQTTEKMAEKLNESRFGQELWKYFAVTALVILVLEMLLFREKGETGT
ncbi:MAG: hypothetical protein ACE5HX_18920, partial [bacterium]